MRKIIVTISLLGTFALPLSALAFATGVPYGGLVTAVLPCTCSGGLWMQYTPFWFGAPLPSTGALYIPLGALIYPYYQLSPGTWELGSYIPGPGECFMLAPDPVDPCIPLLSEGTVDYTGTSSLFPISVFAF